MISRLSFGSVRDLFRVVKEFDNLNKLNVNQALKV
jgi:hypothetical protein